MYPDSSGVLRLGLRKTSKTANPSFFCTVRYHVSTSHPDSKWIVSLHARREDGQNLAALDHGARIQTKKTTNTNQDYNCVMLQCVDAGEHNRRWRDTSRY